MNILLENNKIHKQLKVKILHKLYLHSITIKNRNITNRNSKDQNCNSKDSTEITL